MRTEAEIIEAAKKQNRAIALRTIVTNEAKSRSVDMNKMNIPCWERILESYKKFLEDEMPKIDEAFIASRNKYLSRQRVV